MKMKSRKKNTKRDLSIVLCGGAGQGIQTVEQLLTRMLKLSGYYVFATKEYMSRVRGGSNSTQIRISDFPVQAPVKRIDLLIALDNDAISHVLNRIDDKTIIIGDPEIVNTDQKIIHVSFQKIAKDIGNVIYTNTIAVGLLLGLTEGDLEESENYLKDYFVKNQKEEFIGDNILALEKGYEEANRIVREKQIDPQRFLHSEKSKETKNDFLVNGSEAVGLGAIAGGCNFISSYPMSPSTGVLVFLSQHANEFNIISEQAEDEIAAINMAIGAWYAGARAMVTTSGGGLALMSEGISLAGMIESPMVIHLAQRPGPATGLPTRTEQGDLNLALYAGHGVFPKIILAPGQIEEAYQLTKKAFYWADQYQVPVFILTDQFMMDTYYNTKDFDVPGAKIEQFIIRTKKDYQRYQWKLDQGISPRGIPNYGEGLVRIDSDEHDQSGLITEDMDTRSKMMEKRMGKMSQLEKVALPPSFIGSEDYRILCVGWGSTFHIIKEALEYLNETEVAFLHYQQVYPLSEKSIHFFTKAEQIIVIENNYDGQFSRLLEVLTGIEADARILKYNGLPFYVEELAEEIRQFALQRRSKK